MGWIYWGEENNPKNKGKQQPAKGKQPKGGKPNPGNDAPQTKYAATAKCPTCKTVYTGFSDRNERGAKQGAAQQVADCVRYHATGGTGSLQDAKKKSQYAVTATCPTCGTVYTGNSKTERGAKQGATSLVNRCQRNHAAKKHGISLPTSTSVQTVTVEAKCSKCGTVYSGTSSNRGAARSWAVQQANDCARSHRSG